ncbi:hypothetical protein J2X69_001291 [Algoriphagus sp. 4150]|uniref:hypothetical protein n=1 Tax=Algoriphagus sp. 4150 TaxID=2817756 RepID=UPI00286165FE|nr:hypothetical protein [Algoriphagus sp. 4150]MDR7128956.1 hypothetical protein [Algoriphagus sp. 4150]
MFGYQRSRGFGILSIKGNLGQGSVRGKNSRESFTKSPGDYKKTIHRSGLSKTE